MTPSILAVRRQRHRETWDHVYVLVTSRIRFRFHLKLTAVRLRYDQNSTALRPFDDLHYARMAQIRLFKGAAGLKFKRRQPPLPSLPLLRPPSSSFLSPAPFPSFLLPIYQLGGLLKRCELQVGSGAKLQPLNDLVHI